MGDISSEAIADAKVLAKKISMEDYMSIKRFWERRDYAFIAVILRRYGLDFKGVTYLEMLIDELMREKEQKKVG